MKEMKVIKRTEVKVKTSIPAAIESIARKFGNYSSHVIIPKQWIGKHVRVMVIGEDK